jgi:peptidylprolyl isomerase
MAPKKQKKHLTPAQQKQNSNRTNLIAIGLIATVVIVFGIVAASGVFGNKADTTPSPTPTKIPASADPYTNATEVLLQTSMGDITIALRNDMPITTGNFVNLVQQGKYDGTIFHRVIAGFMIQGGDPTGTGYGDPTIPCIKDEFTSKNHNDIGTIAMANAGPNTGSSQFFINLVDNNYLDTKHPKFGKVVSGMDVVETIAKVRTSMEDRPFKNVTIINASILP